MTYTLTETLCDFPADDEKAANYICGQNWRPKEVISEENGCHSNCLISVDKRLMLHCRFNNGELKRMEVFKAEEINDAPNAPYNARNLTVDEILNGEEKRGANGL